MRKSIVILVVFSLGVTSLFAHAGHGHTYLGTITKVNDGSFVIKTTDGKQMTVAFTRETTFVHSDNHTGKWSDLVIGSRVAVKMSTNGKTAANVRMSAPPKPAPKKSGDTRHRANG